MTTNQPPTPDPPPLAYFDAARAYKMHEERHNQRTTAKRLLLNHQAEGLARLAGDLEAKASRSTNPEVAMGYRLLRAQVTALASGASTLRAAIECEDREAVIVLMPRRGPGPGEVA